MLEGNAKEAAALTVMLADERQERSRIVQSLRSTIQRVRASGHEEDRLQAEVMHLTSLLATEKQKREECERAAAVMTDDLTATRLKLKEGQAMYDALQVSSSAAERSHGAEVYRVC